MKFTETYGSLALVTGAAMGLGREFSRQCAARGLDLLLVDRDREGMNETVELISRESGVAIMSEVGDLSDRNFLQHVIEHAMKLDTGLLINNAGMSQVGRFLDLDQEFLEQQALVNVVASLNLTRALAPSMVQKGKGGVIMVSSGSANTGTALSANYAGTKAWNLIFGESLWYELKPLGVDVLSVIVGATESPGWYGNNPDPRGPVQPMKVEDTVREALDSLGRKPSVSPGLINKISTWFMRTFPRKMTIKSVSSTMERMFER